MLGALRMRSHNAPQQETPGGLALNLAAFLHRSALLWPERPALAFGATAVATYRDLARQAAILARNLRDRLGLAPGDRAAIVMTN